VFSMVEEITQKDLQSVHYTYYLWLISFTILYYDYFLTLSWEVDRVWKTSGLSWATAFFYFNRYVCLLGHIPVIFEYFWSTSNPRKHEICHDLHNFHQFLAVAIQVVVACMLVMRVYALYGGSRFVLFLYIFVIAVASIITAWSLAVGYRIEPQRDVDLPVGCGPNMTHFFAVRCAIAWGSMLVFDIIAFSMTVYKSVKLPRLKGTNLVSILFRDGAIYFGVIAASNLANILTFLLGSAFTRGILTTFTNIISSVMISRLVLNLRHPSLVSDARRTSQTNLTNEVAYSALNFTGQAGTMELSELEISMQNTGRRKLCSSWGLIS